ncbi:MAG: hypothetical protein KJ063_00075 [Anaerolineae bacterium]|nr:hypothetical protein [Anaerolineae bacterium]
MLDLPLHSQICYLLAFPYTASTPAQPTQPIQGLKDAPYFQPVDIEVQSLAPETMMLEGIHISIQRQVYDKRLQIIQCHYRLADVWSNVAMQTRLHLEEGLQSHLLPAASQADELFEAYTILLIQGVGHSPDQFVKANGKDLARFLRPQRDLFGPHEIEEILFSRVRYSENDLTLVDWDGAVIISPAGDYQSDIELLKIGSYQLLRYRILDKAIETNLQMIGRNFQAGRRPSLFPTRSRRMLRQLLEQRLLMLLDFERIDQNLLLIGDWYTAKLYNVIHDEFYLGDWKSTIKDKLDSLESLIQIMQDNFTVSWSSFIDLLQVAGWLLLLIGYIILFFIDVQAYLP